MTTGGFEHLQISQLEVLSLFDLEDYKVSFLGTPTSRRKLAPNVVRHANTSWNIANCQVDYHVEFSEYDNFDNAIAERLAFGFIGHSCV